MSTEPPVKGDRIRRNAIFAFAAQMSTAAFTAGLTIFLTRRLGPEGYGIFALALGFTGLLRRPAAGGTTQATARFVAERLGDATAVAAVVAMALRIRLLTAGVISGLLFALAGPIAELYDVEDLAWPLRGMAVAFLGQSLLAFATNVFIAARRASGSFALVFSEAALETTGSVVLVLIGGGVIGAAFGRAIGYLAAAVLGLVLVARLIGRSPLLRSGRSPVSRREFVRYSGAMLVVSASGAIFSQLDVLLVGALMTTTAVGIYSAPLRLIAFLRYPGQALAQGVAPRLARHPDDPPRLRALERALGYMVLLQSAFVAVLLVWAEPITRLVLGVEYLESAEVLRALTPFVLLNGINSLVVSPLNYAGEGARRIPLAVGTVILAFVLYLVLIPEMGVLGAALGTNLAFALYVGGHLRLCHRRLGLPVAPLAWITVRALFAAGLMAIVLSSFGTGSISALEWLSGLILGTCAYIGGLIVTRLVSIHELRALVKAPLDVLSSRRARPSSSR